ncbi:elongation factor Ts [Patescibacteria group bacterium]|nr:MAG: elongation factor Ts [Patescibacteria group bacterium]
MTIDPKIIMQLREMTGAGIVDAKKALEDSGGDLAAAADALRAKGLAKAAGKSGRATAEGLVHAYIHSNGKVGAMVELLCETDFVARTEQFKELAHDLAMHIAAANPLYLKPEDVPAEVAAKEKEIYAAEIAGSGKSPEIVEKIVAGKLEKYYSEVCLLRQTFVKDEDITVGERVQHAIAQLGENIQVRRFARFALGG